MKNANLILLFSIFVLFSCNKKEALEDEKDVAGSYYSTLRSSSVSDIKESVYDIWNYAYTEYGMQTMCSCDCDRVLAIKEIVNTKQELFPELTKGIKILGDCEVLQSVFSTDCNYENAVDFKAYAVSTILPELVSNQIISNGENALIAKIIDDVYKNKYNEETYISIWESLPENQRTNNQFSMVTIASTAAAYSYMTENEGTFVDTPQAIFSHISAGIVGAGLSLVTAGLWDTAFDSGLTEEDLPSVVAQGFITGFVGSL